MKQWLSFCLAAVLMLCLCACGGNTTEDNGTATTTTTTTAAEEGDTTTTTVGDTTTAPSDTTGGDVPTTAPTEKEPTSFHLLAIGDGMVVDAVQNHLYAILRSAGYDEIHLGILYAAGSTLDTHYDAVKNNKAVYEYRLNTAGKWQTTAKASADKAFQSDWDYVVIQQSAAAAGQDTTYGNLGNLTALIQGKIDDGEIYYQMPWAFQQGSKVDGFKTYYNNQQLMFRSIVEATLKRVLRDANVCGLIPTAAAIQNLRTSTLRDTLTTDGAHLTDTYGDYTAALTWYCRLTGEEAATVSYRPAAIADHGDEIIEAVTNALSIPTEITPAAKGDGVDKSIRILAVGNSFSIDAMYNHLYKVLEAAGYDDIRLGILYVGGCSIDMHYSYIKNDTASYEYLENIGGKWTNTKDYKASTAFALTDWDFVTVQQVSGYSGRPDSYGNLDALVNLIRPQIGDAKLYWQMTWAYQQDSDHHDFAYFNKDQMTMYNAIVSTVQQKIVPHAAFAGVLPSGTAIQNLRTSSLGDTLTADGYHLEDTIGDYTAALTWYCTLTGNDAFSTFYYPTGAVEHFYAIAEAVDNAVANPWKVTESTY